MIGDWLMMLMGLCCSFKRGLLSGLLRPRLTAVFQADEVRTKDCRNYVFFYAAVAFTPLETQMVGRGTQSCREPWTSGSKCSGGHIKLDVFAYGCKTERVTTAIFEVDAT